MSKEDIKEKLEELKKIALKNGWKLNPDESKLGKIIGFLIRKDGYCPCREGKAPDIKCPCKYALSEINNEGHCHCYLFFKK